MALSDATVQAQPATPATATKWTPEALAARKKKLKRIFILLASIQIIINLDAGAVPAGLLHIGATFGMDTSQLGLLAMLVYQGIALGCLTIGPLTRYFSPLRAQQVTLLLNISATFLFGASSSIGMLLGFRITIGFLQAMPAVYFPVWVDEFAPADSVTVWMAVINAGAPLGITIGYVFSGALNSNAADPTSEGYTPCAASDLSCPWRFPFYLQSVMLVVLGSCLLLVPRSLFDLGVDKPPADELNDDEPSLPPPAPDADAGFGEVVRERGESLASYLVEALQPVQNARPIDAMVEPAEPLSPEQSARAERMNSRIRRMSLRSEDLASAAGSQRESGDASSVRESGGAGGGSQPGPRDAPTSSTSDSVVSAATGVSEGSTPQPRFSTRAMERLSTRGPRLTVADPDQAGRGRVVSLFDLFTSPAEELVGADTDRSSQHHDSVSSDGPAPAGAGDGGRFKPTLAPIESSKQVRGTLSAEPVKGEGLSSQAVAEADEERGAAPRPAASGRNLLCELLGNGVYVSTVMALSSLFFVVTGVQVWVTSYIVVVIGMSQAEVTPAFGVTSITAPIIGVICGGIFIDKIGGYKGEAAMALTLKCCFFFACCAAGAAITCAWVPRAIADQGVTCISNVSSPLYVAPDMGRAQAGFWSCIGLIAVTLVFGGAIIPAATGCLVAAVPADLRQISSAMSMFCFQQLGYALSPLASALVGSMATFNRADVMSCLVEACPGGVQSATCPSPSLVSFEMDAAQEKASLELCFQVVMLCASLGIICLFMAWRFAAAREAAAARLEAIPPPANQAGRGEAVSPTTSERKNGDDMDRNPSIDSKDRKQVGGKI